MIPAYPDTSFIYRIYETSQLSVKAQHYIQAMTEPLPVTGLLRYEFMQSVRLQMHRHNHDRKEGLSRHDGAQLLELFTLDLSTSLLSPIHIDFSAVLAAAEIISARHTRELGYRAVDILHIAAALHLKAKAFLTFDKAQAALAQSEGLETPMQP